jgi:hypothetical protein
MVLSYMTRGANSVLFLKSFLKQKLACSYETTTAMPQGGAIFAPPPTSVTLFFLPSYFKFAFCPADR